MTNSKTKWRAFENNNYHIKGLLILCLIVSQLVLKKPLISTVISLN